MIRLGILEALRLLVLICLPVFCGVAFATSPGTSSEAQTTSGMELVIEPRPEWIQQYPDVVPKMDARAPMQFRLVEHQVLINAKKTARYTRKIQSVHRFSGLDAGSQIEVTFDPAYQQLIFHELAIVRGNERRDKLKSGSISFLQREPNLERQMIDGRITASIVLDDVQVGDEIELAYTIRGANPVFDGRFVDMVWARSDRAPINLYRYRLLSPASREIKYKVGSEDIAIQDSSRGSQRELLFEREGVAQFHPEVNAAWRAFLPDLFN